MKTTTRFVVMALTLAAIVGGSYAAPEKVDNYTHGTIVNICAPNDAPQWQLILTEKPLACQQNLPQRYLSISLDYTLPQTAHLPNKDRYLQAYRRDGSLNDLVASGTVTIDRAGSKGTYRLTFKSGIVERGKFEVERCETYLLCG